MIDSLNQRYHHEVDMKSGLVAHLVLRKESTVSISCH